MRRTKAGIVLEKLLHGMKYRYVLCWSGNEADMEWGGAYDCACCIAYVDEDTAVSGCGCVCHQRIEKIVQNPDLRMFLLALSSSEEMPFVPKDYVDWMTYNRKLKREHDVWRKDGSLNAGTFEDISTCCEACKMVQDMETRFKEHQKDPKMNCGKPCGICDEHRAAAAKELKEAQRAGRGSGESVVARRARDGYRISEKLARKKKRIKVVKNNESTNQA